MSLRNEEPNDFNRAEVPSIGKASKDLVDGVEGLRDSQVGRSLGGVGATNEDEQLGCTSAIADTDCTSELDAVKIIESMLFEALAEMPPTSQP